MSEHVIVTDDGGIRTIRISRPEKKNALTIAMYEAMIAALDGASADDAVRCVLIAGVPGALRPATIFRTSSLPPPATAASIARRCASCRRSSTAASRWWRR